MMDILGVHHEKDWLQKTLISGHGWKNTEFRIQNTGVRNFELRTPNSKARTTGVGIAQNAHPPTSH
jgi:hypothetical protein